MRFFLSLCLLSAALTVGANAQDVTATAAWQVTKYDVTASLPTGVADRNLNAKATLNLKNVGRAAGATVTLRINPKAEIVGAKSGDAAANFRKTVDEKLGGFQRFSVSLPASVPIGGAAAVTVEYRLPVGENTGLNAVSVAGSQFLPLSQWYPTPNNPYSPRGADHAPFRLQVVNGGETVVSSGKAAGGAVFEQNLNGQPFFVSGSFDVVEGANNISAFLPKGAGADERKRAEEVIALTNDAKNFISGLLGANADLPPLKIVAVRRGAGFANGGTILLDAAALRRQKIDSNTALTIAEAVAQLWIGGATAIRAEGHGAISEGLTRFIATEFIEKQFGKEAADVERLRQRNSFVATAKRDAPLAQASPADGTFFASVPNKGAMLWRLAAREMGEEKFFAAIRANLQAGKTDGLTLARLREDLAATGGEKVKTWLNYGLDQVTDTDLLVGLPVVRGAETIVNLKNGGSLPITVNVVATTDKGEKLTTSATIPEKNFGQAVFKTPAKIVRVEVDPEKIYPQIDYANDFAPKEIAENDWSVAVAALFNRQLFAKAEEAARKILAMQPRLDDVRVWLGRSLLEQNRLDEAEREFNAALSEKLPTPKTLAWANVGLGEISLKRGNTTAAAGKFFETAVRADAEYASNLAARQGRLKTESAPTTDEAARTFFAAFDKAVLTARKAEVESFLLAGELAQFASRLTGNQPENWQTQVLRTEMLDANRMAVEVNLTAKLLDQEPTTGTALFFLARTANGWKLAGVDLFEVR